MQNFVMVKQKLALTFWLSYDIHSAGLEGSDYTLLFQEQRELAPQWERPFLEEMRESLVVEFTQIFFGRIPELQPFCCSEFLDSSWTKSSCFVFLASSAAANNIITNGK